MDRDAPVISAGTPFTELVPQLLSSPRPELLVVDDEGTYVGTVALNDIKASLADVTALDPLAIAADAVNETIPFVLPSDTLDLVMHLFGRIHRDELPVCADPRSRRVVGVIDRDAVIDAYNRRIFQMDLTGGFGSLVAAVQGGRTVEVLGGLHLGEVEAPSALVGETLSEARLRSRFDVEVILIQNADDAEGHIEGRPGRVPTATTRLAPGDRLLVMGTPESIERLRRWDPTD